jgi:hypothetical protein
MIYKLCLDMKLLKIVKVICNCTDGGQNLACALANKSALVFSVPLSNKGSTAYTGSYTYNYKICK